MITVRYDTSKGQLTSKVELVIHSERWKSNGTHLQSDACPAVDSITLYRRCRKIDQDWSGRMTLSVPQGHVLLEAIDGTGWGSPTCHEADYTALLDGASAVV